MSEKYLVALFATALLPGFLLPSVASAGLVKKGNQGATEDVIVVFKSGEAKSPELIQSVGGKVTGDVDIIPAIFANVPKPAIKKLSRKEGVSYVELDKKVRAVGLNQEGLLGPPEWVPPHKKSPKQITPWGIDRIDARKAAKEVDEDLIDVAILDTGIDYDHKDLSKNVEKGAKTAGWGPVKEGKRHANDRNGHGTHVSGTVAAINNEVGVVGVGPVLDLYAVKVLNDFGYGTYSDLIQGIDWAVDEGAEVINMSLGGDEYSNALEDACDKAYEKGVVLVAAAGNDGDGDPSTNEVCYPAKYKSVIAVAATNKKDKTPEWSSEGSQVELAAPGVDILSTTPHDDYDKKSGTSMATPHVSGTAALVIVKEGRNPDNVREILHSSCIDLYSAGRDNYSGYGLIQADNAVALTG